MRVLIGESLLYTENQWFSVLNSATCNRQAKGSGPAKVLRLVNHPAKVSPLLGARC
jgi:hypothetical protein